MQNIFNFNVQVANSYLELFSSYYTGDKINEGPLTLSVLSQENCLMKNKNFHRALIK